jgi:hypothetical protein
MSARRALTLVTVPMAALLLLAPGALAAGLGTCLDLRERRDELARRAMAAELVLVRQSREQICPALTRAAEAANADSPGYGNGAAALIDLQALRDCRQAAEQRLERRNRVRYRNRLGFTFYTPSGAALAAEADRVAGELARQGCEAPP